jgi:Holliday junction resolvasome RuvABC endonuclease subunit
MFCWLSATCACTRSVNRFHSMGKAVTGAAAKPLMHMCVRAYLGTADERSLDEQDAEALRLCIVEELLGEHLDPAMFVKPWQ